MTLPGSAVVPRACHGSAVAFLIVIAGGRMILGNDRFVGSVWHPPGAPRSRWCGPSALHEQCRSCCGSRSRDGL